MLLEDIRKVSMARNGFISQRHVILCLSTDKYLYAVQTKQACHLSITLNAKDLIRFRFKILWMSFDWLWLDKQFCYRTDECISAAYLHIWSSMTSNLCYFQCDWIWGILLRHARRRHTYHIRNLPSVEFRAHCLWQTRIVTMASYFVICCLFWALKIFKDATTEILSGTGSSYHCIIFRHVCITSKCKLISRPYFCEEGLVWESMGCSHMQTAPLSYQICLRSLI